MSDPSAAAALIRDFANTIDVEEGTDLFADTDGTAKWLRGRGLLGADGDGAALTQGDRERAVALRAGLRERLLITGGGNGDARLIERAQAVLEELPLSVVLATEAEPLRPGAGGRGQDALARIAAAWAQVVATEEWRRLKRCPDHSCGWVFWDATRSRTRRWCTMRVCGNRAKTRTYSERRRTTR